MFELSILIPAFEQECFQLVETLQKQAEQINDLIYEIIVSDDASSNAKIIETNTNINILPNCRLVRQSQNIGRSANRNALAQIAQYSWLLYIDSHMKVNNEQFLKNYCDAATPQTVCYGSYTIPNKLSEEQKHNLRAKYESHCKSKQELENRLNKPYENFHTANFLIPKETMLQYSFNESITQYGYEDVLYGMTLRENRIPILHIDNPVLFDMFESNEEFLQKTEQSIHTLHAYNRQLTPYSTLIRWHNKCKRLHLTPLLSLWHRLFAKMEKTNLKGKHPNITLFQFFKLGLYNTLQAK